MRIFGTPLGWIMWLIYDIYYRNYVATTFDVLTMGSNLTGFFLVRRQEQP